MSLGGAAQPFDLFVKDINKSFDGQFAVRGVSFGVRAGQLLALLGPSGCGKTTVLRIIAGLLSPDEGDVRFKDRSVLGTPVHKRGVGILFQNYALFPHYSVAQNVAFGLRMRRMSGTETASRVREALALVRLEGLEERMPHQLSGGQQQRVALARALAIKPLILLLDEPFAALDRKLREAMQIELRALQVSLQLTTVLVTHDQDEALTLADEVAVMRDGWIEQIGSPSDIYARPTSRFVADFVGISNFFMGRLMSGVSGEAVVDAGALQLKPAKVPAEFQAGSNVTVALRPERLQLKIVEPASSGPNQVRARLERVVYRGALSFCHLRLEDGRPLIASLAAGVDSTWISELQPGQIFNVSWDRAANLIIRDESASGVELD